MLLMCISISFSYPKKFFKGFQGLNILRLFTTSGKCIDYNQVVTDRSFYSLKGKHCSKPSSNEYSVEEITNNFVVVDRKIGVMLKCRHNVTFY